MTHFVTPPEHVQLEAELEDRRKSGFHAPIGKRPRAFRALPYVDFDDSSDYREPWIRKGR